MPSTVELLAETDSLLEQAKQNLKTLGNRKMHEDRCEKFKAVARKVQDVEESVASRKADIVECVARAALCLWGPIQFPAWSVSNRGKDVEIAVWHNRTWNSDGDVVRTNHWRRHLSPSELALNKTGDFVARDSDGAENLDGLVPLWYAFCADALERIEQRLKKLRHTQTQDVALVNNLLEKLKSVSSK